MKVLVFIDTCCIKGYAVGDSEVRAVKSSTFQMSKEGVNSGLKSYQAVRAKGDWHPQVLYAEVLIQ